MKYTKRAKSIFVISTMILAIILSFVSIPVMAISPPGVYTDDTETTSVENRPDIKIVYGDTLWVSGTGVTAGETVNIYWDFVQAAHLLNSTTAENDGSYGCYIDVPAAYNGSHFIWAKDLASGVSERSADANGIKMWQSIELDPDAGLAGDECTVSGYGYDADTEYEIGFYNIAMTSQVLLVEIGDDEETDDDGSFEITLDIPNGWGDGVYWFNATTGGNTNATAMYTIGPAVVLDVTEGPAGIVVKADGRGFGNGATIESQFDIIMTDGVTNYPVWTKDGADITTGTGSSGGKFTAYIVIPGVPADDYDVIFTDSTAKTATDSFEVNGETEIEITPTYGTPGTVLTVKGYNYTQVSGIDVDLAIESQTASAKTDANGMFTATITIPPLDFGERYDVWANDTKGCNGTAEVLVALIVLQLSDYSAPVGSEITLMGSGFSVGGDWNATFGTMDLIETQTIAVGKTYFSYDFYVPTTPSGTYTIGVYDVDEDIEVGIDFTVTDQASLSIQRVDIPNEYNLTLEGENFVELDGVATEWWIFNSTEAWNIDANVTNNGVAGTPVSSDDGTFIGWYLIPKFLELGSYTINCTTVSNDQVDPEVTQYAEIDIELVPEEVILNVGSASYARGQTITFVIKATLTKDPFYLGIKDPEGSEVFNSTWAVADWKTIGAWYYIPSNLQIDDSIGDTYTLPADAMPGTWTYAFWSDEKVYATGSFEVTELTEIEQLQQDIGGVASSLLDLGTSVTDLAGSVVDVSGAAAEAAAAAAAASAAAGDAKDAADAAAAAVADVGDTANDALDAANDAKSSADAAKTAADSGLAAANDAKATAQSAADAANDARDAAEGAQTAASGLTTLVYGAIGASLIAALAAIVSLMQISRRIAG